MGKYYDKILNGHTAVGGEKCFSFESYFAVLSLLF